MTGPLTLDQKVIADSILADYNFLGSGDPGFMDREEFRALSTNDQKTFLKIFITDNEKVDFLVENLTIDEIYDIITTVDMKEAVKYAIYVLKTRDALIEAIKKSKDFNANPTIEPKNDEYLKSTDIDTWKTSSIGNPINNVDSTSDEDFIIYNMDNNNPKTLFVSLLIAVPELLNQLILKYKFHDKENEDKEGTTDTNTIDEYKNKLKDALNDHIDTTDGEVIDLLAVLAFICFGKLVNHFSDMIDSIALVASDDRAYFMSVVLTIAGVGVEYNNEIIGDSGNVINGVKFVVEDGNFDVYCQRIYIERHTHYEEYEGWLPSSFYSDYDIHAKRLIPPKYKNTKDYWKRVMFEAYDTTVTSKSTVRYIASKSK